jgi:hypothetical protein
MLDRDGARVGDAWLTVDEDCALLHSLASGEQDVRWLLHTEIGSDCAARPGGCC